MRNAISYWAMRVCDFGVAELFEASLVEPSEAIEHAPARCASTPGGIRQEQHRVALRAQRHALMLSSARSRCPTAG